MKILFLIIAILFNALLINSCEKSTTPGDVIHGEPTKLVLTLTDLSDVTKVNTFTWSDADGKGGANPIIDTISLISGKTYRGALTLFDSKNNNLTTDIKTEQDDHQFFYQPKDGIAIRVVIGINDKDSKNLPVGLDISVSVVAGKPTTGLLNLVLSHYDSSGVKNGTTKSLESDIDIDLPVRIE